MQLTRIRIQNYRCFDDVTIRLGQKTLLIGENDTGKSALLYLLAAIFGTQRAARLSPDDIYTEIENEDPQIRDPLEIELVFQPDDPSGALRKTTVASSAGSLISIAQARSACVFVSATPMTPRARNSATKQPL
jgi:ABC-type antimicrobial peptide transport system ATPase subunit